MRLENVIGASGVLPRLFEARRAAQPRDENEPAGVAIVDLTLVERSCVLERPPYIRACIRVLKLPRHDTDDRIGADDILAIANRQPLAEHIGSAAEVNPPQPLADHDFRHGLPVKMTAETRRRAERLEEVS